MIGQFSSNIVFNGSHFFARGGKNKNFIIIRFSLVSEGVQNKINFWKQQKKPLFCNLMWKLEGFKGSINGDYALRGETIELLSRLSPVLVKTQIDSIKLTIWKQWVFLNFNIKSAQHLFRKCFELDPESQNLKFETKSQSPWQKPIIVIPNPDLGSSIPKFKILIPPTQPTLPSRYVYML